MKALVLGSAGGGYPGHCNCPQCLQTREGAPASCSRTRCSLALSSDGRRWVVINASPDLGQQLRERAELRTAGPETPIAAMVLTSAQIDHVAGLLSLREGPPIDLYCTPSVFDDLTAGLPLLPALQHYCGVHWHLLPVAGDVTTADFRLAVLPQLRFHALAIEGRAPRYSAHALDPAVGDQIALLVQDLDSGALLFFAPQLARFGEAELHWMRRADCVMIDADFCRTDGAGRESALAALSGLAARRKILVHIHNRNPILDSAGHERRRLEDHGIEVAYDGMEITL